MIEKILVANRGEIACRILRTCQALGIRTVAVYSEADRLALHVLLAGQAVCVGPAPSTESYLVQERILEAAKRTGAQAIHPGYGFLSENPDFAQAVLDAGLTWIGPPPEAIRTMGLKTAARKTMIAAGVPVVPGTEGPVADAAAAAAAAEEIGYPLLIKASAGGGGKGMRIVEEGQDVAAAFTRAASEAFSATGNAECYIERFFPTSHHVEVQVLSGPDGTAQALGERECSIQRRHQKVIEECPSPFVDQETREGMHAAACAAAEACGYVGAGTVEFLVDPDQNYFFLEMNTRLQVEHAVTEMVFGVDLVEEQIRIADGLSPRTGLQPRGWAIEARVYAEDPFENFRPCPGPLHLLKEPHGPSVRVDSGVYQGGEVSRFYDPMISKVITWGSDREAARRRMVRALEEYVVDGVATTIPFCIQALESAAFRSGCYTTSFVGSEFQLARPEAGADPTHRDIAAIAAALARRRVDASRRRQSPAPEASAFKRAARRAAIRGGLI